MFKQNKKKNYMQVALLIFFVSLIVFIITWFFYINQSKPSNGSQDEKATKASEDIIEKSSKIDISAIELHTTENDCWMAKDGKIYDLSGLFPLAGLDQNDCGKLIDKTLPQETLDILNIYYIADLDHE